MYVCMYVCKVNDWEPERKKIEMKKPFCLRVFVYQCKDLPAVDDNYLIDPYVKVCIYMYVCIQMYVYKCMCMYV